MLSLLTGLGAPIPTQQETINLITEKKPAIVEQIKEPTLTDKITSNFYKCTTDTQYIRADNAECLDKPQYRTTREKPTTQAVSASSGTSSNGYQVNQCTWGVKNWKPEVGNNWADARNWGYAAQAEGWTVSDVPVVGAVAWSTRGAYGHVALVLATNGSTVTIKEQNYDWNGSIRVIDVPTTSYQYIYR